MDHGGPAPASSPGGQDDETALLEADENADAESSPGRGVERTRSAFLPAALPVFTTMHRVRGLVIASIDDPYTLDQLTSPRINTLIVRPLADRLYDFDDISLVYCLLANRVQFLSEQSSPIHRSVNVSRATLCELVATRILRRCHEDSPGGLLHLAKMLVQGFDPFQGAPEDVERNGRQLQWPIQERDGHERKLTALELAILSDSKTFISSSACQRVVDAVYRGQVVYSALSFIDIIPDHYKHHPVSIYDPRKAPLLNHYRLVVPRYRNLIELIQFLVLVGLYIVTMLHRHSDNLALFELVFVIYATGWVLHEVAAIIEHGWAVHAQNLSSFLDSSFIAIFAAYVAARVADISVGRVHDGHGLSILCIAAPILLTRLAFHIMPDNIVFISLHILMKNFLLLTTLAVWCFVGFFLALQWLYPSDASTSDTAPGWPTICKWLLWIWFSLDGTGIEESVQFHVVLGPALMVAFAFLGNTLFLTVLVAMLTYTFSKIVADETAEINFRRAVLTFEGVKSDAVFSYPPPFNLLALALLLPLKFVVSPRIFHSVHVAAVRVVNAPTLLLISLFERRSVWAKLTSAVKRSVFNWQFTGFSPHGDIQAVFRAAAPPEIQEEIDEVDGMSDAGFLDNDAMSRSSTEMRRQAPVFRLGKAGQRGRNRSPGED